jgi:hypothetical protein
MTYKAVGTCGSCGGCVSVPYVWNGLHPPKPQCLQCGKHPKESFGKIIPMEDSTNIPLPPPRPPLELSNKGGSEHRKMIQEKLKAVSKKREEIRIRYENNGGFLGLYTSPW